MTVREEADKLCAHVVKKAMEDDTSLNDATDALKAVTAYLTMDHKRGDGGLSESDETSFDQFREDLKTVEEPGHGTMEAGSRRRRPRAVDA